MTLAVKVCHFIFPVIVKVLPFLFGGVHPFCGVKLCSVEIVLKGDIIGNAVNYFAVFNSFINSC